MKIRKTGAAPFQGAVPSASSGKIRNAPREFRRVRSQERQFLPLWAVKAVCLVAQPGEVLR